MRFDDEKILADADMHDVCNMLGVRMRKRGSSTFIACPEHISRTGREDVSCDKCGIKKGYYHCFSCGASGNVIRLVRTVLGCGGYEARRRICEMLGGTRFYADGTAYGASDEMPYDRKELEALGLCMTAYGNIPKCLAEDTRETEENGFTEIPGSRDSCLCLTEDGKHTEVIRTADAVNRDVISLLYTGYRPVSVSIRSLYMEDREAFFLMIRNKAGEMWAKYEQLLADDVAGKILPEKTAYYVNCLYKTYLETCKRIYGELEYTKNRCIRRKAV